MKRTIAATLATALMATTAQAGNGVNTTTLYNNTKTFWVVENYTYDSGAVEQCVMGTSWSERNKTVRSGWYLKFNLEAGLYWGFDKTSWRMTPGNLVENVLSVDGTTFAGKATVQSSRSQVAAPFIGEDSATSFLAVMRKAKQLSVIFPTAATETPFIVKVDQKALAKFEECSSKLIAESGPPEEAPEQNPDTSDNTNNKFRGA